MAIISSRPLWCAVCDRPVAFVHRFSDRVKNEEVWIAQCHGEKEEVRISRVDLMHVHTIEFNIAFKEKEVKSETFSLCIPAHRPSSTGN